MNNDQVYSLVVFENDLGGRISSFGLFLSKLSVFNNRGRYLFMSFVALFTALQSTLITDVLRFPVLKYQGKNALKRK